MLWPCCSLSLEYLPSLPISLHIILTLPGWNPDPVEVNGKTPIDFTRGRIISSKELYGFTPDCSAVFTPYCIPYLLSLFSDKCSPSCYHLFWSYTPGSAPFWNESASMEKSSYPLTPSSCYQILLKFCIMLIFPCILLSFPCIPSRYSTY